MIEIHGISYGGAAPSAHLFPPEDTKPTEPLEILITVIIQEFHAQSTFNKPSPKPHLNLLESVLTMFSERKALFPQCTLGNICVQTSWPCKGRFRAPFKTSSFFVLRCSGSLKGYYSLRSEYLPGSALKNNICSRNTQMFPDTSHSRCNHKHFYNIPNVLCLAESV